MSTKEDFTEKIACKVCGKEYQMLTPQHLYTHQLTIDEYKAKYPGSVLKAGSVIIRGEYNKSNNLFKKDEEKGLGNKTILEQIEKIPKVEELKVKKIETEIEEIGPPAKQNFGNMSKGKLEILNYLVTKFKNVKNNFVIEKMTTFNRLEFNHVTDIVLWDEGIDLEFPNSFWHNYNANKVQRDEDLKKMGWKIITIDSRCPTVEDLKKILERNKLI